MPQEYWYPISGATHDLPTGMDDWSLDAGTNKNSACRTGGDRSGPVTHDDATSYLSEGTNGDDQALNIDWPVIASWDGVLTAAWRIGVSGASGANDFTIRMVNAAGTTGGVIDSQNLGNTGFVNSSLVDIANGATYRPGGSSWSASDFTEATTFARLARTAGADGLVLVTSVWGEISYSPPSGGFAFLLGIAGLGALPLGALDFSHFLRLLSWRRAYHPRHTLLTRDETLRAWREVREYRHPRFFFPAVA